MGHFQVNYFVETDTSGYRGIIWIFTESAPRPIQPISFTVLSVCLSTFGNPASRWTGDFWLKSILLILAYLLMFLRFCGFDELLHFFGGERLGSLQTSLLCIVGEIARGGSVAVAVGVSHR